MAVTSADPTVAPTRIRLYEIGGQLNAYRFRVFRGLDVGLEVLWIGGNLGGRGSASGLALGPLVGYKWISAAGFTIIAQGGLEVIVVRSDDSGGSWEDSDIIGLLNLNIGWSF